MTEGTVSPRIESPRFEMLLAVDVPPVETEVKQLLVRCGHTTVVVREDNSAGWRTWADGYFVTPPRYTDYDAAVGDARRWAHARERQRLLSNELTERMQRWVAAESAAESEWRGRKSCRSCEQLVCAVGAEDPCPGCCECVGRCIGEPLSGEDGEPRG